MPHNASLQIKSSESAIRHTAHFSANSCVETFKKRYFDLHERHKNIEERRVQSDSEDENAQKDESKC